MLIWFYIQCYYLIHIHLSSLALLNIFLIFLQKPLGVFCNSCFYLWIKLWCFIFTLKSHLNNFYNKVAMICDFLWCPVSGLLLTMHITKHVPNYGVYFASPCAMACHLFWWSPIPVWSAMSCHLPFAYNFSTIAIPGFIFLCYNFSLLLLTPKVCGIFGK